jgi:ATP-dependent helicase HrpB
MNPVTVPMDLPVAEALPALKSALAGGRNAVLVAPPGAGKTTLVPLVLARRTVGEGWTHPGAGAAPAGRPRRLAAHGLDDRRGGREDRRPCHAHGASFGNDTKHPRRHRGSARPHDPRRSGTDRRPRHPVRRIPRTLARRRFRPGAGARHPVGAEAGSAHSRHVGDTGRRTGGQAAGRRAGDREQGPRLPGRHPPPRACRRHAGRKGRGRCRRCDPARGGAARSPSCPACARSSARRNCWKAACRPIATSSPCMAGSTEKRRTPPSVPRHPGRRKLVLATAIAETSVTIDGVRIVIDCGLARQPVYEPATGLTRLETVRSAAPRSTSAPAAPGAPNRASRSGSGGPNRPPHCPPSRRPKSCRPTFPNWCWPAPPSVSPSLRACPSSIRRPHPPGRGAALLAELGAIDAEGRITETGQKMRGLALPVRLAHMLAEAARTGHASEAAELAVLIGERGLGGNDIDLDHRLDRFGRERGAPVPRPRASWPNASPDRPVGGLGRSTHRRRAAAHPRLPRSRRPARGEHGRFVLANGRGGVLDAAHRLAASPFLVVADLQGKAAMPASPQPRRHGGRHRQALGGRIETVARPPMTRRSGRAGARDRAARRHRRWNRSLCRAPKGAEADRQSSTPCRLHGLAILPWGEGLGRVAPTACLAAWRHGRTVARHVGCPS